MLFVHPPSECILHLLDRLGQVLINLTPSDRHIAYEDVPKVIIGVGIGIMAVLYGATLASAS